MKRPFRLSKLNYLYFSVAGILLLLFFIRSTSTYTIDNISELLGKLTGLFVFPLLFALLFWFFFRKSNNVAPITFNVVLIFILISKGIRTLENNRLSQDDINAIQNDYKILKDKNLENPDSLIGNFKEFHNKTRNNFDQLIEKANPNEKEFYRIMKQISISNDSMNTVWQKSLATIDDVFDFKELKKSAYCDEKIYKTSAFIEETKSFKNFFLNRPSFIENKLKKCNIGFKDEIIKSVYLKFDNQKKSFIPHLNAHIQHGMQLNTIYKLFRDEKWSYSEQNGLHFKDSLVAQKFNVLYEDLEVSRNAINDNLDLFIQNM